MEYMFEITGQDHHFLGAGIGFGLMGFFFSSIFIKQLFILRDSYEK